MSVTARLIKHIDPISINENLHINQTRWSVLTVEEVIRLGAVTESMNDIATVMNVNKFYAMYLCFKFGTNN